MMTYTVQIIDTKDCGDGQVAFLARSNNDPTTDSWATVTIDHTLTEAEVDALVEKTISDHKQRVAQMHAARDRVRAKLAAHKDVPTHIAL